MTLDFDRICRICLEGNKETCDIYTSYYVKRKILYYEMLTNCTKLKPHLDDGFPRLICKECVRKLKRVYNFILTCEESEVKLKTYLEWHLKKETESVNTEVSVSDVKKPIVEDEDVKKSIIVKNHEQLFKQDEIKEEKCNISDNINDFKRNVDNNNLFDSDIKVESACNDSEYESCWDADDDNQLLLEIKQQKESKEDGEKKSDIEIKPKKKRGRKKVYLDGETPKSRLPHQCDICGKFLSTKSNLKAHKILHTDLRPFKCTACPATFKGYSALFQHNRMHSNDSPYHCEHCPKQFKRRSGLVNHVRIHTGEKSYSCDICFKSFIQKAQLSTHMKRHKGEKPYLCQDCGKGFPIKSDLIVHRRMHNGEKPYSCHLCTKRFATSGNLSIHVRIHNKEIRYQCKECQRGFVTPSAYNLHVKRHTGQKDHQCECGKMFYTTSGLKQHKVVHTGEKRYQCKICDRKFSQTSHLSRHFKRDHAKPNAPVPGSQYYKIVLPHQQELNKIVFDMFDVQNAPQKPNTNVKCEGS